MRIIALSSSRGTTFQAILDAKARGDIKAEIVGLVTDREDQGCVVKAKTAGVPVRVVERSKTEKREAYDHRLNAVIRELAGNDVSDVVIAAVGWMWILGPAFVRQWKNRILNVHPALLPKHPGAHAHAEVLRDGDTESGITIHWIDAGVDTGPVVLQQSCPVLPDDTEETLKTRVQELEKEWYPKVLAMIERGEV
ncbi:MAG: phosphoribosylglycinamide formyltransferase [Candidatus Peribacteraceae bacterium]|nr:phosphoribosylglycinamide formyltransferase [Candidatus Peribacteraceae bacterium]